MTKMIGVDGGDRFVVIAHPPADLLREGEFGRAQGP